MKKQSSKQKNNLRIGLIVAVIIIAIIIFIRSRKPSDQTQTPTTTTGATSSGSGTKTLPRLGNDATLKSGTKAQEVQWTQSYYNSQVAVPLKKTKLTVDGIFGPKTQAAVKSVTGKTSTTWTEFKRKVDGTASSSASTSSIYQFDWQNSESQWPWETQS